MTLGFGPCSLLHVRPRFRPLPLPLGADSLAAAVPFGDAAAVVAFEDAAAEPIGAATDTTGATIPVVAWKVSTHLETSSKDGLR